MTDLPDQARELLAQAYEDDGLRLIAHALRTDDVQICYPHRHAIRAIVDALKSRADEVERLREALTPSGDTKAAYSGEFRFPVCHHDEDGEEVWHPTIVPWDTIKEIMAAIMARAALNRTGGE